MNRTGSTSYTKTVSVLLLFIACLVAGTIYAAHFLQRQRVAPTNNQTTKGEPAQHTTHETTSSAGAPVNSPQPGDNKGDGSNSSMLLTPTGDFVSNHNPNLSGKPAPNTMTSVCTTTPGAQCQITFSKDGVVKSLPSQTTDRGGSTYWYWKLQDIGITAGSWKIMATASLDGKAVSATDALPLTVNQ